MKYIVYDIENIEPIKQTATLMQADNEFTKSYISGSNIRGAFIANYMYENKVKNINEGVHREKLLKGGLKFLNAYPMNNTERTLPFPKCYYGEKESLKKISKSRELQILKLNDNLDENKDYKKIKSIDFATWDIKSEKLFPTNIDKIANIHIRKGHKEDNKIFRYEAIEARQNFKGIIICEKEEYAQECKKILENGIFYVGGSKGSGYGLCSITNVKIESENPELLSIETIKLKEEKELVVIAASDIVYRDNLGIYKSTIDKEFLMKELKLKNVELKHSYIETDYFTGFNNKWGYRLPNIIGIKAGSVFVYKIDGSLDKNLLKVLMDNGIGERKSEGFGRIVVLPKVPFKTLVTINNKKNIYSTVKLESKEKQQMELIVNRIYREKLKNKLSKRVLDINEKIEDRNKIKVNQWGKLYNMMLLLEGLKPAEGLLKVKNYFENINNKKENRELTHAISRVKVKGLKLQKFIEEELDELNEKVFNKEYLQEIKIGACKNSISKEEIYEYKLQVLKELFRLQLREGIRKGEK